MNALFFSFFFIQKSIFFPFVLTAVSIYLFCYNFSLTLFNRSWLNRHFRSSSVEIIFTFILFFKFLIFHKCYFFYPPFIKKKKEKKTSTFLITPFANPPTSSFWNLLSSLPIFISRLVLFRFGFLSIITTFVWNTSAVENSRADRGFL